MRQRAALSIDCGSADLARLLLRTLEAEHGQGPEGSSTRLALDGATLQADVAATDLATLRAAVNSVARQADAALRTLRA